MVVYRHFLQLRLQVAEAGVEVPLLAEVLLLAQFFQANKVALVAEAEAEAVALAHVLEVVVMETSLQ
jgi:hypothetical protein